MTKAAPDFDVEKRRRCYAVSLGAAGASSLLAMLIYRDGIPQEDTFLILSGFWVLFFIFKSVAGYAVWFWPYTTKFRSISLSCLAIFLTYAALFSAILFYDAVSVMGIGFRETIDSFIEFHISILGLPYFAAGLTGILFSQSAPDIREQF